MRVLPLCTATNRPRNRYTSLYSDADEPRANLEIRVAPESIVPSLNQNPILTRSGKFGLEFLVPNSNRIM